VVLVREGERLERAIAKQVPFCPQGWRRRRARKLQALAESEVRVVRIHKPKDSDVNRSPKSVRFALVIVAAAVLLSAGALMLVLPGPGRVLLGAGLALLAGEFPFVRHQLELGATIVAEIRARLIWLNTRARAFITFTRHATPRTRRRSRFELR